MIHRLKYILVWVLLCRMGAAETVVFVDSGHTGKTADGSAEAPFASMDRAQAFVRRLLSEDPGQNITVWIRGGRYYLQSPLCFDWRDSAADGFRVLYKGDGDSRPELVGGQPVSGWEEWKSGIFRAPLAGGAAYSGLIENGVAALAARTPNAGYFAAGPGSRSVKEEGRAVVVVRREDQAAFGDFNPDGVQVVIWSGQHLEWDAGKNYDWSTSLLQVDGFDSETRTLRLTRDGHYTVHPRNRYYLRGALAFLDQPGEFYLDRKEGWIYYRPRRLPIGDQHIVLLSLPHLIEMIGDAPDRPVRNLIFDGLDLIGSAEAGELFYDGMFSQPGNRYCSGMVQLNGTRDITLRNCRMKAAGLEAVGVYGANTGLRVENNLIEDGGGGGVVFWGPDIGAKPYADAESAYVNKGHKVFNNHIRRCGRLIGHRGGVEICQAGGIEISHNLIEEMPRYAINALSGTFSLMMNPSGPHKGSIYGRKVTWENHYDFIFTRDIHVHHNECRHVLRDSQDAGAINFYGVGLGNRVDNNLIHHLRTAVTDGYIAGIYLDDHSNGFLVRSNVVARIGGAKYCSPMIIKGVENVVNNNILADNEATFGTIHILQTDLGEFDWLPEGENSEETNRLQFHHNIFYRNGSPDSPDAIYSIHPWKETMVAGSDFNVFWHDHKDFQVTVNWAREPLPVWKARLGGRYEAHSMMADPLFVDADNMDYRLKPESPALKLGFHPIDIGAIGLQPDFPFNKQSTSKMPERSNEQ
jgi:hypothetical protein